MAGTAQDTKNELVYFTLYKVLVKSNWWSIINAAFWLFELLLG